MVKKIVLLKLQRCCQWASIAVLGCLASACVSGSINAVADSLSQAMLDQDDPATVRDGAPAYLILLDGLILNSPEDDALLLAGSRLYDAYAIAFTGNNPERAQLMSQKALDYAQRALCLKLTAVCNAIEQPLASYQQALNNVTDPKAVPYLYHFASAWAGWIQANPTNWQAIAELPKVQASIERVLALEPTYQYGNAHLYMGVLLTLRPASLGGQPEQGRWHFEQAIQLSDGHNLMAKVLYAQHYARLVFDRDLHDQLLQQVLTAAVEHPEFTLSNALAQQNAKTLLDSADDYF